MNDIVVYNGQSKPNGGVIDAPKFGTYGKVVGAESNEDGSIRIYWVRFVGYNATFYMYPNELDVLDMYDFI